MESIRDGRVIPRAIAAIDVPSDSFLAVYLANGMTHIEVEGVVLLHAERDHVSLSSRASQSHTCMDKRHRK